MVEDFFRCFSTTSMKVKTETRISELNLQASTSSQLTPDQIKKLFSVFTQFVREKNFPEVNKFIDHYVEKVVVFHNHIELTLKVFMDLHLATLL